MKKRSVRKIIHKPSKYYILFAFIICAILAQVVMIVTSRNTKPASSDAIDWGLSYQGDHETPIGNAENETLLTYGACYTSPDETEKAVYLTFDAGYENGYTEIMLDTLKEHNVTAAFFLTGNYFETYPEIAKRMFEEGHLVCNHTMNHPDTTLLTQEQFNAQLTDVEKLCLDKTGYNLHKFYRPPSGRFDTKTLEYANSLGYKTVLWSVTYLDWDNDNQKSHDEAITTLMNRHHKGAVILLHATSKTNSEILGEYITQMKAEGYEFKTLNELF